MGEALLEPHLSYLKPLRPLLGHPRASTAWPTSPAAGSPTTCRASCPRDTHALIRVGSWPVPELFHFLQEQGEVETEEMFRVFNMGIGMILAVEPAGLAEVLGLLRSTGQKSWVLGTVQKGGSGVVYDLGPETADPRLTWNPQ